MHLKTGASGPTNIVPNGDTFKTVLPSPQINSLSSLEQLIFPIFQSSVLNRSTSRLPPAVENINKYGGFDLTYPRLAYIDGEQDVWRPATPHASPFNTTAHNRTSTIDQPFILIEGAVHHWDENGVFANETTKSFPPKTIKKVQSQEIKFVKKWMEEWKRDCGRKGRALV